MVGSDRIEVVMFKKAKEVLMAIHRGERGAMSVEKILLIALIALPIIIILLAFRKTIIGWFQDQSQQLQP
jgi:Flp pilus assembly pilin Flp